jgi:hypothetical protein
MTDKNIILTVLANENIPVLGAVVRDSLENDHFFVYIPVRRNAEGHQEPSNRLLHRAREVLKDQGVGVEFILTDAHAQDVEAGVRATLLHAYGEEIRNVFLSMDKRKAVVWVEQKKTLDDSMKVTLGKKASLFLKEVGLELGSIFVVNEENTPGKLAFLKALRQIAPADPVSLKTELLNRGFSVPSDDWVRRKLDTLRKSDAIVRLHNGYYVVPAKTFEALGTIRSGRSPDVSRLLALARKFG